ncbi:MAG: branched-chain amino acid aminotransferase [bacterium]
MGLNIEVNLVEEGKKKKRDYKESELGFGKYQSDHMFIMEYDKGTGWENARIVPYQPLVLDPAALNFHYGQTIFEGLKAYRGKDNGIYLFRPKDNMRRMNNSATRMCMPRIDEDFIVDAIRKLVLIDKDWIPSSHGTSLYIRPVMIGTEPALGVKASKQYIFYIIVGPVGSYYAEGLNPIKIYVSDKYVRAVRGGIGEAKAGGNYAASLYAAEEAKKAGYSQVLWLDAIERKYVEEVGAMNIFFSFEDKLVTPSLSGSILPGITRDSVIKIAKNWDIDVEERMLAIDEVIEGIKSGSLKEVFGSGTAAIISPVGKLFYKGESYTVSDGGIGELTKKLYDELIGYQYGEKEEPYGWVERIDA